MITRGILEAQEKKEADWWAQKQDSKEYVEQLKDAQNVYNTNLFLEQRTRDLRRRDMGYDSDGMQEDTYADHLDDEFDLNELNSHNWTQRTSVERISERPYPV